MTSRKVVGVFLNSAVHQPHVNTLTAMTHGIRETTNDLVFLSNSTEYMECDVAIIFGSWKDRRISHHLLKNSVVNTLNVAPYFRTNNKLKQQWINISPNCSHIPWEYLARC